MRRTPLHLLVIPVAALAITQTAGAQSQSRDNMTGVWALTNARIETVTKGTIERGTVVIRDGVIEAVGASITPPADARVVDLSGKTIAPAFIDLTSSLGLRAPAQQGGGGRGAAPAPIPGFPGAEPDVTTEVRVVGLEPDRVVAEELNLSPADARTERDHGIGAVLVSPNRGLFRGLSALLPMRDDTASRWIVKSPVALHVGYQTVPGDYPSNLLGVIAYQRQAFYDAQRHAMIMDRYKANPKGMPRTAHNAELEALVPVVKGDIPVFIAANNENEMLRALALGKEFNLKVTLVGAVEGFRAISALKTARPPVVTVDFPTPAQTTGWQYQYSHAQRPGGQRGPQRRRHEVGRGECRDAEQRRHQVRARVRRTGRERVHGQRAQGDRRGTSAPGRARGAHHPRRRSRRRGCAARQHRSRQDREPAGRSR